LAQAVQVVLAQVVQKLVQAAVVVELPMVVAVSVVNSKQV
jgi:hypothetical protein